ncbi:MAG: class I SAM-dependent methyltransferase [Epsilonproteobacteria bacterium]|nr:class I SAM-dependent methyltransferase [Campylobacterota bacterium]
MNRFDLEALTWDDLPRRVNLAKDVIKEIAPNFSGSEKVLDLGCGTGLVGLNIAPFVKEVIGIDTSKGMVEKFNQKAKKLNLNAKAIQQDIFDVNEKFDAVISSMTIHHIKDINALSNKLKQITNQVFIADLCKEDGSFHTQGNDDVWHFGFEKDELKDYFKEWQMEYKIIHTIQKHKPFDVFLIHLF